MDNYTQAPRGGEPRSAECEICGAVRITETLCTICHFWHEELDRRSGDLGGSEYLSRTLKRAHYFVAAGVELGSSLDDDADAKTMEANR